MSGDELIVTLVSLVIGVGGWGLWLFRAGSIDGLGRGRSPLTAAIGVLAALSVLIMIVLRTLAADDVRHAPQYLFMYLVLGLAWLKLASSQFPMAGLHPRDDLIERRNHAALPAWIGAMTGVTLCYSGANIGNGPGWWVVVFSAALATAGFAAVWLALGTWAHLTDAVVIDRDPAAGVRLGGALAACGLVFGTSVAGDWVSAPVTVADFVMKAWPVVPMTLLALWIERGLRPGPERPRAPVLSTGALPAVVYLAAAIAFAWREMVNW